MKERNAFFASAFSRELDRWQKETGKTAAQFAEYIGVHQNNISRYKKGDAFPTDHTMGLICGTLNVDSSIFYPSTFEDKFNYDENFQQEVMFRLFDVEYELVDATKIDRHFWIHFWGIDGIKDIFPFSSETSKDWVAIEGHNSDNEWVGLTLTDYTFVKSLQSKVEEYIMALVCKAKYDKERTKSQSVDATNTE